MVEVREKPGGKTPWTSINQLLPSEERFEVQLPYWQGYLLAPKGSSRLTALLYLLHQQQIPFCIQGRGTFARPESHHILIISTRALSHVILHDKQGIVEVEAGCSLSQLQSFLFERRYEVSLEGDPLALNKRSVGGILLSGRTGGMQFRKESIQETILGVEMLACDGSHFKWGGCHRSACAGPALHKLVWGWQAFPGILLKVMLKVYPLPPVRLRLAWSFRQLQALWDHFHLLKNFATTWEYLDCVQSGQSHEQGFVLAQISGLPEEMESFQQYCPSYQIAREGGDAVQLKFFLKQQMLNVHLVSRQHPLAPDEYLWYQGLDDRAWWLTPHSNQSGGVHPAPLWKQRLWDALS